MAVSDYLGLQIMEVGAFANTWGDVANIDLIRLEAASRGYKKITLAGAETLDATDILTDAQIGLGDEESFFHFIELAGTAGTVSVQVKDLYWIVYNNTDGNLTFQPTGETGITLTQGKVHHFYYDLATTSFVDVTALQIPNTFSATTLITGPSGTWDSGGMDLATTDTYAIAGTDVLSATTLGTGVLASSLTSLGTIASLVATTADINAGTFDGIVGGTTPAAVTGTTITANTAFVGNLTGNASGTAATVTTAAQPAITSLGTLTTLTVDSLTLNGTAITSTGVITLTANAGSAVTVEGVAFDGGIITGATLVAPALGTPASGVLTLCTGTAAGLTAGNVTTNANLTGAITSSGSNATSLGSFTTAELLAAVTGETGTGAVVFATSPTLVTPALGTPSSGVLTQCTGTAAGLTAGTATVANGLKTATTTVSVSASAAPSTGQTLVAVDSTTATWQTPAGSGNVSNTGTPLINQLAVWTDATTVQGDAALTWDGTSLVVGVDDTTRGNLVLYGPGTGQTNGGEILMHLAADHDAVFQYIKIDVANDDLRITDSNNAFITWYRGDTGNWEFPADITVTGTITVDAIVQPKIKIIDIGDWDMSAATGSATTVLAHGLTATDIRSVQVTIRQDVVGSTIDFGILNGSESTTHGVFWSSSQITLSRGTGGYFDNTTYNATTYNRGWVTIVYV